MQMIETICAISTPLGTAGIGVVRMSGTHAISIAERMFRMKSGKLLRDATGYTGALGRVYGVQGDIDDAIAYVYRSPNSYTGEDIVEFSCHGNNWILQKVLQLCIENGAQPAGPGEFTKRAFLNGKMALSDAEAVMDLIHAQGEAAARAALSGRDGALSTAIGHIVEKLLDPCAHLAAWVDYPEEEIEAVEGVALTTALQCVDADIQRLLLSWDRGKIVREGILAAIVGKPNVGKSTLMNLLTGRQKSIVTEIPGTTRDVVEDCVQIEGCVLRLADTAGIRDTDDIVESIGVDRAREYMQQADLILAVFDSSDQLSADDCSLLQLLQDKPCIAVINKIDLPKKLDVQRIGDFVSYIVTVSAQSGTGKDALERAIAQLLQLESFDPTVAMVATQRQYQCLLQAGQSVREARDILQTGMMLDAVGILLEDALDALLNLTGKKATEMVVNEVFARFCVGK